MKTNEENVYEILDTPIKKFGYNLIDIKFNNRNCDKIIQLFIYHTKGIGFNDCEKVNNLAWDLMYEKGIISENHILEISSPGIFMKLDKPEHYKIFKGKRIKVKLLKNLNGVKIAIGHIDNCTENGIHLKMDDPKKMFHIPFTQISEANLEPKLYFRN
tara:strand:+ start:657 stop:1130 length:474 start_codon:yes stop_codon:yes gene_type:complete